MTLTVSTQQLLQRVREILPISEDEIVQRGITESVTARIVELRRRMAQLTVHYTSIEILESQLGSENISPSDHTLYTDLLEWRAARHELSQLTSFLGAV